MKDFSDRTAVITGAASGIGYAIAEKCAEEGMNIVLADIEETALNEAKDRLKNKGAKTLAIVTDVSKEKDVITLANKTYDEFKEVNLLFNNAGVYATGSVWDYTHADWEWVIGVNLWGVIHGLLAFLPRMMKQENSGYIINTSSTGGLATAPHMGSYCLTKHAIVSLSETLYYELAEIDSNVKVSVICPGFVRTRLDDAERNRPPSLRRKDDAVISFKAQEMEQYLRTGVERGKSPDVLAEVVFDAIRKEQFYILPHNDSDSRIRMRMENILLRKNPT